MNFAGITRCLVLAALTLAATGCIKSQLHRPQNIEPHDGYTMAFVEFDDQGEPWAPSQLERTIDLIERANRDGKRSVVALFVHGWQNDASKREDRKKDNNVEGFQRLLASARKMMDQDPTIGSDVSLIGVYLGWRGKSTNVKLLKPLTFYSRRGAGQRVAGLATTEAIIRVMHAANAKPESGSLVIGHSFGGMIVELALMQALVGYTVAGDESITPLADLVMLVNPASQSMVAKNMVSVLERNKLQSYRKTADGNLISSPFIVSVTSTADTATGNLYPFALGIKGATKKFRGYGGTDCSPAKSQKEFYKTTAGHNHALHSHVVTSEPMTDEERESNPPMILEESINPENGERRHRFPGEADWFTMERLPLSLNDTPYWIMSVPPELIPDHTKIFTVNMLQLIRALVRASGVVGGDGQMTLVREEGVRPLELAALPQGGVAFLDATRRFHLLKDEDSRPVALSCLPMLVNTESVIGVFYNGSRATMIASGSVGVGDKVKNQTVATAFDFGLTGAESQQTTEIKSDVAFDAAIGNPVDGKVYLAAGTDLYVADMNKKKPKAELLASFDKPAKFDEFEFDSGNERIFAMSRESEELYVIDLRSETLTPELIAGGIGVALDMVFTRDGSLLVLDSTGGRVLRADCSRERGCSRLEEFASSSEFRRPIAIATDADGLIWIADLDARSIFTVDKRGRVTRVLGSKGEALR
jgi:hypothetical protein